MAAQSGLLEREGRVPGDRFERWGVRLCVRHARGRPPTERPGACLARQACPYGGDKMRPYLRLRQECLAAPHLEASAALIRALLGLEVCHRDAGVARYGLETMVFPIGPDRFLEVVSPTRPSIVAGRFLGVRLANHIDRDCYRAISCMRDGLTALPCAACG